MSSILYEEHAENWVLSCSFAPYIFSLGKYCHHGMALLISWSSAKTKLINFAKIFSAMPSVGEN